MFNFASGLRNIIRSSLVPTVKAPKETNEAQSERSFQDNGDGEGENVEQIREECSTPETSHVGRLKSLLIFKNLAYFFKFPSQMV